MTPLPQLLICGDPHGQLQHIMKLALEQKPDAVVLLGDITIRAPLSTVMAPLLEQNIQVCWIPGNHDVDDADCYLALHEENPAPGVHALHGRVVTVHGREGGSIRLAGLGGIFKGKVWYPRPGQATNLPPEAGMTQERFLANVGRGNRWRGGLPLHQRATIFADEWLAVAQQQADILVTHEAPHFHSYGFRAIHELAVRLQARYSFHGHQHETRHYGCIDGVQAHGVGLRSIVDLSGRLLVHEGLAIDATPGQG